MNNKDIKDAFNNIEEGDFIYCYAEGFEFEDSVELVYEEDGLREVSFGHDQSRTKLTNDVDYVDFVVVSVEARNEALGVKNILKVSELRILEKD